MVVVEVQSNETSGNRIQKTVPERRAAGGRLVKFQPVWPPPVIIVSQPLSGADAVVDRLTRDPAVQFVLGSTERVRNSPKDKRIQAIPTQLSRRKCYNRRCRKLPTQERIRNPGVYALVVTRTTAIFFEHTPPDNRPSGT